MCLLSVLQFIIFKTSIINVILWDHTFHIWKTVSNCSYLPFCQWINFSTGKFVGHFSFSFSSSMGSILVGYLCWIQYSLCFKAKCSVAKSWLTLRDPMDCGMPGFPVPHCHPEFAQVHVHWISDAIQPSYLLLPSSLSALNLSQRQGLFQRVCSLFKWPQRTTRAAYLWPEQVTGRG